MKNNSPKIVMIGGGTGSFTLLKELKHYVNDITALVSMADNGGSTGQLRDEYGVLPPGDIRQCLVALSNSSQIMRDLFNFRFEDGSIGGHSFGNLFLSAVEKMTNNFAEAVELASTILSITGRVVPITLDNTHLLMSNGETLSIGEEEIGNTRIINRSSADFRLDPPAKINPIARQAIMQADLIIIAPGNFYGSLVPALIVEGVDDAIKKTRGKVVQVINLVTKPGQTDGWCVSDYVNEVERFCGLNSVDFVLYNTKKPTKTMLSKYAADGEFPVRIDKSKLKNIKAKPVAAELLSSEIFKTNKADKLKRTLIRHDGDKVARQLMKIYYSL